MVRNLAENTYLEYIQQNLNNIEKCTGVIKEKKINR